MSKAKPKQKPSKVVIPKLFRAVEKDTRPIIYYGYLIADDGLNFISYSCSDQIESHFRERDLLKEKFNFFTLCKEDLEIQARRALCKMREELQNKIFEMEAAQFQFDRSNDILGEILK